MNTTTAVRIVRSVAVPLAAITLVSCDREEAGPRMAQQGDPVVAVPADVRPTPAAPARFAIGRPASGSELKAWDIDIGPDGADLPPGRGTYAEGVKLYAVKCAACHGPKGEGVGQGPAGFPRIIGREPRTGFPFGEDPKHVKTVGNYWPYATTVFDYVRRAMPLTAPGSLTDAETYSLVAFLLAENEIVGRDVVMDAATLRKVQMPARDRFVVDNRRGGPEFK